LLTLEVDTRCQTGISRELDLKIRTEILALDNLQRSDEIYGTVHVTSTDEGVMEASLIPLLEARGVSVEWKRK
jgi:hypothetical protein